MNASHRIISHLAALPMNPGWSAEPGSARSGEAIPQPGQARRSGSWRRGPAFRWEVLLTLLVVVCWTPSLEAQTPGVSAEVRGLMGRASVSSGGSAPSAVRGGTLLKAGDVLQVARESAVDLFLGPGAGTVRLTEGTTVSVERMSATGTGFDIELSLREGEVLGRDALVPAGSKFVVRTAAGFGAVLKGQFRFSAKGYIVLLDGKIIFVQIPAGGTPVSYTLTAPAAVYWSPAEGMKAAPSPLVREVKNQMKSKLPKG